jgi:hypothetical protein
MLRSVRSLALFPAAILALAPFVACGGGGDSAPENTTPTITSFSPTSGSAGTSVTLTGTHFTGATAVKFNGTAVGSFTVASASSITTTVPAGATSGPVTVTTASGTGTSATSFTITTPSAPVVASFNPSTGKAGDTVTVTGSGFTSAASVTLGGTGCAYNVASSTSLTLTVPATATGTGVIAVTNSATPPLTGASASTFAVQPGFIGMNPKQGPVGTPVVITGSGFTSGSGVTFNAAPATAVTVQSPTQLTATVPSGAATGPVTVSANGSSVAAGTFTVGAAGTTQDLSIDGMYLVQSVQDYAGTVPLVANRDAVLRVFVKANQPAVTPPSVQVTLTNGGTPWTRTLAAPGGMSSTPTTIDESQWASSWNLSVPAAQLQPGATILARVNPTGAIPEVDGTNNDFPVSGAAATLSIQSVKTFKTTLVPITQQGLTGNVNTGRTPESWVDRLQRMYPIGAVNVQVRSSALTTTANLNNGSTAIGDNSGWSTALQELDAKRVAEASDRYYFGSVNVNYSGGTAGLGYVPNFGSSNGRSALGWDKHVPTAQDGYNYPEVFAHEVGHNFGRHHAPCGVEDPDDNWPTDPAHAEANIGVYGYDVANSVLKLPTAKDIMSYCDGNLWVSDYTFKGVLAYRAAGLIGLIQTLDGTAAPDAIQECLLVSGSVRDGKVELNPGFQVRTVPTTLSGGSLELLVEDSMGNVLRRAAFEPILIADLPEGQELRHFTFAIPMDTAAQSSLHRLKVQRGAETLAERRTTLLPGSIRRVREPVAMALSPRRTHLSWDHQVHGKVLVRDPRTGEVIAFLEGGSAMLESDATELEFTFSDGVRSERRTLKVLE